MTKIEKLQKKLAKITACLDKKILAEKLKIEKSEAKKAAKAAKKAGKKPGKKFGKKRKVVEVEKVKSF